jgi:predicted kinase
MSLRTASLVAAQALRVGVHVVLDWNHFSRERRANAAERAHRAGAHLVVHHLDVPVATAVERARARRLTASLDTHRVDSEGVRHSARIFELPSETEGLTIVRHSG